MNDFSTMSRSVLRTDFLRDQEFKKFEQLERHFFWRPKVKILIVTDGGPGFTGGNRGGSFDAINDFGLGEVIDELEHDPWWWVKFEITTAHRRNDALLAVTAMHKNFRFDTPPVPLASFDQIWIFAVEGRNDGEAERVAQKIQPAEVAAITAFMNAGGGVFASGDHFGLGECICAELPRIGKMRHWKPGGPVGDPPTALGNQRYDTSREGPTSGYQFSDQSDNVPQPIYPTRYYDPWNITIFNQRWRPHPILCGRNGLINVLPDHMHENRIVQGATALAAGAAGEWPGAQAPEVIATARVIAHTNTDGFGFTSGPVAEEGLSAGEFGVLGAYDGHTQNVGRIAVDATWHHWFHVNVMGFDTASANYDKIRNYWWNVALWLSPKTKQQAIYSAAVHGLIYTQPFNELSAEIPVYRLGFAGVDAIGRRASLCTVTEWTLPPVFQEAWPKFKWRPIPPDPDPFRERFTGLEHIREFALGGALRETLRAFGGKAMKQPPAESELVAVTERGARAGVAELLKFQTDEMGQMQRGMGLLEKVLSSTR